MALLIACCLALTCRGWLLLQRVYLSGHTALFPVLLQVYHAPPLVKKALANLAGLDKFYVVEHNDVVRVQKLMEDKGIRRVFTPQVCSDKEGGARPV